MAPQARFPIRPQPALWPLCMIQQTDVVSMSSRKRLDGSRAELSPHRQFHWLLVASVVGTIACNPQSALIGDRRHPLSGKDHEPHYDLSSALTFAKSKECGSNPLASDCAASCTLIRTVSYRPMMRLSRVALPHPFDLSATLFLISMVSLATAFPANGASRQTLTLALPTNLTSLNLTRVFS